MNRRDSNVESVHPRLLGQPASSDEFFGEHSRVIGDVQNGDLFQRRQPQRSGFRVSLRRLVQDELRDIDVESLSTSPPFARDLLMSSPNQVLTWMRGQVADHGCFDVGFLFHGQWPPSAQPEFGKSNRVASVSLAALGEVNAASKHEPISYGATLAYQQVASMIPETIPVILESIVSAEFIDDEIEAAHETLAMGGTRPRV